MFLKNAWYCAGWASQLSQGRDALLAREIAGESVVLYRKLDGQVVALEDRCCHRQAPLSLGRKEGDCLRCMYHGWKFGADGVCVEIPGQAKVVQRDARVRSFPVEVRNDLIWVWMGDVAKVDTSLICHSVGPTTPGWDMRTAHIEVQTNYRFEIANLNDLTHQAWVHEKTFGGTDAYCSLRPKHTVTERGLNTEFWACNIPPPAFLQHLFDSETRIDGHWSVEFTVPCNFMLHFRAFTAGTIEGGPSNGTLILDSFSSQAVTPRDEHSVDYYYSWGVVAGSVAPGMVETLIEANNVAFLEDKRILEGQYKRVLKTPNFKTVDYAHDAGPGKMLWVLDKLLKEEQQKEPA